MHYFEIVASEFSSPQQRETTTALGPFVVEAVNERAALSLVGLNYSARAIDSISKTIWDDLDACEVTRLPIARGSVQPREALIDGCDLSGEALKQSTLLIEGEIVARMIWWPCAGPDIYPFGDAILFGEFDGENGAQQLALV